MLYLIRGSIEGHACHAAERVIAVSGVLKEEVCGQYQVDGRKVEVIYNGHPLVLGLVRYSIYLHMFTTC